MPSLGKQVKRRETESEELARIEREMRAGDYVTLDEWERKHGYTSRDK